MTPLASSSLVALTLALLLNTLLLVSSSEGVCNFEANTPIPFDEIKNCALNTTLDPTIFSQTLSSIRKTIPMYVFLEYVKDASDPHFNIQVDLLAELEKISQQHYERDFDFHQDLVALFRKLNDGHTLYFGPQCYGNLVYRQPFSIISYVDSSLGSAVQKIGIASLNNASGIVNYYQQLGFDLNSHVGSEIKEIDGQPALDFISKWANEYSGGYKDPGARFNVAISNLFMTRSLNRLPIPSKSTVTYVLSRDGAADVTLELPWVGSSLMSYNNSTDFYQSCLSSPSSSEHASKRTLTQQQRTQLKRQKLLHPLQEERTSPLLSLSTQVEHKVVNLLKGDQVSYFEIDGQVGVITIDSFVPQSEVAFAKDFQMSMYMAKLNKIPKLIIDVTNNGGGEECLGYALIKYLYSSAFSQNFVTLFARTDMIATDLGKELALKGASQLGPNDDSIWNPATWRDIDGMSFTDASWYTEQQNYTRGTNVPSHAYTSILKENYCQSSFDNYYFTGEDLLNYSPDNIILLSNGRCASTCALFTRHLQESKKAKTVVVGGLRGQSQQIAQVPGGQVYEFEDLLADIQSLKINSDLAPTPLPVKSRFRFAIREAYAWSEPDLKPLEFFFEGSDFRLDYSKESAVDRSKVWIDTLQFFDVCAPWQTKSCEIPNGSGQQSCVGGKYSAQCQLVECAPGYGVDSSECKPCPVGHYKGIGGTTCLACTNKPSSDNAQYTNASTSNNCPFECVEGFVLDSVKNVCVESQNLTIGKVLFGFIVTLCVLFLLFACVLLASTIFLFVKNYRNRMANNEALRLI
ncbi:hypothetical protein C9374_002545 [Naegleria lovaniensis]|uniref:Tail specific protease domain-containing protein n=1 Tax=Naegleria lovaniensis TaxID=51637 RepID=A0AA88GTZ9_NAELO|nr:uncharacterized protein C9374_002545 [Naegleria lovaniensis]KAG2386099.1 hypothetical protein C9374_002545 [Naegleria lovaniensis]